MAALQCDICGGSLTMAESGEIAVCDSCGMKHDKHKVQQKVQEIRGLVRIEGAIGVEGIDNADIIYKRALDFLKLNDYFWAEKTLREMTLKHPGDKRGWQKLSLVLLESQINNYPVDDNNKLNPVNINRIIQNAESFGDSAFLDELNAKREIAYRIGNQKEMNEAQDIARRIFANGGCPSKEQFDKAISYGDSAFDAEVMKKMAEYTEKQKKNELLIQYLLNRMRKMFCDFGIDEKTLNSYYANANIQTYNKRGTERRQAEKLYNDARFCKHITMYCGILLNRYWNDDRSVNPLYQERDSITYWVRKQPVTQEMIDEVFMMIESTATKNLCPYCGGSRNSLNWITDKYSTCSKCKKGYIWDYKHYTTVNRPY